MSDIKPCARVCALPHPFTRASSSPLPPPHLHLLVEDRCIRPVVARAVHGDASRGAYKPINNRHLPQAVLGAEPDLPRECADQYLGSKGRAKVERNGAERGERGDEVCHCVSVSVCHCVCPFVLLCVCMMASGVVFLA